jgi:23S rRNA G2069 N7-methylase RlmK/C1962 C5-methylase RlmI
MTTLRFRAPSSSQPVSIRELVDWAWPEAEKGAVARAFDEGRVRVAERLTRKGDRLVEPGRLVELEVELATPEADVGEPDVLARGEGWVIVDKPTGMPGRLEGDDPMHPIRYMADALGKDRSTFEPVWPMPTTAGGPWMCAETPERAAQLRRAWFDGALKTTWTVLVPRPDRAHGSLPETERDVQITYSATTMQEDLAELQLTPSWQGESLEEDTVIDRFDLVDILLDALDAAGMTAVGDRWRGGFIVPGGLRLRLAATYGSREPLQHSWNPSSDWWPSQRVVPEAPESGSAETADLPIVKVNPGALRALSSREGDPWVRLSNGVDRPSHVEPGDPVQVEGTDGTVGPVALAESSGPIAARVWSQDPLGITDFEAEVDFRVDQAIAARADLTSGQVETDFFRLIHAEADQLPGFYLDRMGSVLRATLTGTAAYGFRELVYENIANFDPEVMILEIDASPGRTEPGESHRARVVQPGDAYLEEGGTSVGWDNGLRWSCDPWRLEGPSLDAARREHRRRVYRTIREANRGGADDVSWLCLTAPESGLSIVSAAAGATVHSAPAHVEFDADAWTDHICRLNEIPAERISTGEPDVWLGGADGQRPYDGVAVDIGPDSREMLAASLERIASGGTLLATGHPDEAAGSLVDRLEEAAGQAGREIISFEEVGPPSDFPVRPGFPEGTPFVSVWCEIA